MSTLHASASSDATAREMIELLDPPTRYTAKQYHDEVTKILWLAENGHYDGFEPSELGPDPTPIDDRIAVAARPADAQLALQADADQFALRVMPDGWCGSDGGPVIAGTGGGTVVGPGGTCPDMDGPDMDGERLDDGMLDGAPPLLGAELGFL